MKTIAHIFVLAVAITLSSADIGDRLLELEALVQEQFSENDDLISRVKELEDEAAELMALDLDTEVTEQTGQFASIEREYLPEIANLTIDHVFKRDVGLTPAFHAYLSTNKCYYNNRETMVFDAETLDDGGFGDVGVYDQRDGIFEPPTQGVYVFTWTTAANKDKFTTELVIAGQVAGVMTSDFDSSAGSGIHPATAVVVAHVSAGTHCYIRVTTRDSCASVQSDSSTVRTTFSAWKLFSLSN